MCIILITAFNNYLEAIGCYVSSRCHLSPFLLTINRIIIVSKAGRDMNPNQILAGMSLSWQGKAKEQIPPWVKASWRNGWLCLFWRGEAVVSSGSQPKPSELWVDSSYFSNVFVNSRSPACPAPPPPALPLVLIILLNAGNITPHLPCFGIICERISHQLIAIISKKSSLVQLKSELRCVIT